MLLDRVPREELPESLVPIYELSAQRTGSTDFIESHFDAGQIFELGVICAVLTGMAKFIFVNDLVPKMDHCPMRPRASA